MTESAVAEKRQRGDLPAGGLRVGDRVSSGHGRTRFSPQCAGTVVEVISTYRIRLDSGGYCVLEGGQLTLLGAASADGEVMGDKEVGESDGS